MILELPGGLKENPQLHFELTLDYYYNINIPILGLMFYNKFKNELETTSCIQKLISLEFLITF